ncbi:helix-turn-helix domain-containing protein [Streptomyces sp. MNU89]|uniref:helix-turn-helix domain-containing protein n=1 Tax=Streptomyces sp. MNU89 TaxID=2560025 RepID=UPI001E3AF62C|nr:helix-turn-helix domain-containing protein [Streptomyces sp. MNU89]MCC9738792.1 helix-turn-helix domain-containing protein [Streptomyces sp. MNU89]
MAHGESRRVLDPEKDSAALKALTHPLRIRLLGMLRQDGPATATELSGRTQESSASTSYHLRVLAKYGFVAEAEHRDGRERRWRAVHAVTSWNNAAVSASPEHRAFLDVTRRAQIEHLERSLVQHEEDLAAARLGPEWLEPSGISDLLLRLTPESLGELMERFARNAEELADRDASDPRAEPVVVFSAGLPLATRDPANRPLANRPVTSRPVATHTTGAAADRPESITWTENTGPDSPPDSQPDSPPDSPPDTPGTPPNTGPGAGMS